MFIGLQKWSEYSEGYPTELFIYAMPFSCGHNLHLFFITFCCLWNDRNDINGRKDQIKDFLVVLHPLFLDSFCSLIRNNITVLVQVYDSLKTKCDAILKTCSLSHSPPTYSCKIHACRYSSQHVSMEYRGWGSDRQITRHWGSTINIPFLSSLRHIKSMFSILPITSSQEASFQPLAVHSFFFSSDTYCMADLKIHLVPREIKGSPG